MPVTLAEAKVGLADKVVQEVIDIFRRGSMMLDMLTFDNCISPGTGGSTLTYGYLQLQTPSTADARAINTEYTPNHAVRMKKTADLKIIGGSALVDRVLESSSAQSEIGFQLQQKSEAVKNYFHYLTINGSATSDPLEFDGLSTLLTGKSTEYNAGSGQIELDISDTAAMDANYKLMLDMLDEFLGSLSVKPDLLLGNDKIIAKMTGIARRMGYLTQSEDAFGRKAPGYNGIPFLDLKNYYDKTQEKSVPAIPIDSVKGTTDLYAVKFGLDAFHGVSLTGNNIIKTYLPNMSLPGAVKQTEVEMVACTVLKDTTKAGVFRGIKVAAGTGGAVEPED